VVPNASTTYLVADENSRESFLYVMGFMSYIVFQITVNIGMNIGLVPVAGIALPFISYGGSSLMALFMGMAFLP
jgi:cell division protein FtsW (lipid II flippase)